jgi:hypothetical protein
MKIALIIFVCYALATACMVQGLTNDYNRLTDAQKAKVVELESFQVVQPGFIYKINAQQLKEELHNQEKSIVYIFSNGCTAEWSKPLSVYEEYALVNGYELFLVMTAYTNLAATLNQPHSSNLYVIDNEYYNQRISYNYLRYFQNELTNKPLKEKNRKYEGNLYFFKGSDLMGIFMELPR